MLLTGLEQKAIKTYQQENVLNYLDERYERIYNIPKTVGEVAGTNPDNILLITMPAHITCSMYGVIYDSFDCRDRIAEFCWKVK